MLTNVDYLNSTFISVFSINIIFKYINKKISLHGHFFCVKRQIFSCIFLINFPCVICLVCHRSLEHCWEREGLTMLFNKLEEE